MSEEEEEETAVEKKGERRGREREKAATSFGPFFFVQSEGGPSPDPKTSRERGFDSRVNETSPKKVERQEKQERKAEEVLVFAHEAQATLSQCMVPCETKQETLSFLGLPCRLMGTSEDQCFAGINSRPPPPFAAPPFLLFP